jgi:hypothetical protein
MSPAKAPTTKNLKLRSDLRFRRVAAGCPPIGLQRRS